MLSPQWLPVLPVSPMAWYKMVEESQAWYDAAESLTEETLKHHLGKLGKKNEDLSRVGGTIADRLSPRKNMKTYDSSYDDVVSSMVADVRVRTSRYHVVCFSVAPPPHRLNELSLRRLRRSIKQRERLEATRWTPSAINTLLIVYCCWCVCCC